MSEQVSPDAAAEAFIEGVYEEVCLGTTSMIGEMLETAATETRGRQTNKDLSQWFLGLSETDKKMVLQVARYSVDSGCLKLLDIVDGTTPISYEIESFTLTQEDGTLVSSIPLHDELNALIVEREPVLGRSIVDGPMPETGQ